MVTLTKLLTTATDAAAKTGNGQGLEIENITGRLIARRFSSGNY